MGQIIVYPRFYTSRTNSGECIIESKGNSTVNTLYKLYVNREVPTSNWEFQKLVFNIALTLFGDFDRWCSDQYENPQITGYNQEFIQDCIKYTETGKRALRIENWLELTTQVDVHSKLPISEINSRTSNGTPRSTIEILMNWSKWSNGLEDLVYSLYVLFGSAIAN